MSNKLVAIERDAVLLHFIFMIACVVVLALPGSMTVGVRMFVLVVLYNVITPMVGLRFPKENWFKIWVFAFLTSLFQVLPDWFLSSQLEILIFPDDGFPKIGEVSGYMAGLWTIPLFMLIFIGKRIQTRFSQLTALWVVALASLLIFGISEETMWMIPSWHAVNVSMIGHVAVYLVIPEIILGLSAFLAYESIRDHTYWLTIPTAFLVMLLYTGSLSIFYLLVEKIILTV